MNTAPKKTVIAAGVSLGLGILFDYFFFGKLPGIAFPLYILLVLMGIIVTTHFYKLSLSFQAKLLILPILFFSGMVFVRANEFVTFLNIVATLYLLVLFLYAVFAPKLRTYTAKDYIAPINEVPFKVASELSRTANDIAKTKSFITKHKSLPQVLRGIAITIPVLVVFAILLSSADLVFRQYMEDIFSLNLDGELIVRLVVIACVASVALGIFGYLTRSSKATGKEKTVEQTSQLQKFFGKRGDIEVTILLGSVCALFLCFLLVQLTYLFGGLENITGAGFTYAEYARKGFFELICVAAITFGLVLASEKIMLHGRNAHTRVFKIVSSVLVVEVVIMMVSAFKRLSLYEGAYGFTNLRTLSHIFIVWLAIIFAILLYKILINHSKSTFAFLGFLSLLALLSFINILNIDAFVARKNVGRYYDTGRLDTSYLGDLSVDAVPETVKLLDKAGPHRAKLVVALYQQHEELKEIKDWQSANLSRQAALRVLEDKRPD